MTSAVSTPVLTGPQEHRPPIASGASGTSVISQGRPQALTSIEVADETSRSSSYQHQNLNIHLPLLKDQGETVQGSSITDYQEKDQDQKLQDQTNSNMSRMVKNSSFSTLSSWSSTASVATRTNTDNPASMSHIVTNFNITKSAKQANQANQANQAVASTSVEGMASSTTDYVPAPRTSNNSTNTTPANTSSSSSTLTATHTQSSRGAASSLASQAPSEARRRTRQSGNQAPDSDDDKEYTPMKIFKQTPV